ncbi:unnamed protein product [Orchesella dallaii]|uniref:Uncharacterized protein n=1 Tax=Orchesella dallaii TaxID=48710 RepID=A0ABP1PSS2_9HEXA
MFGLLSVPWDFFHIGLLVVVIMIMITGMVICVSVIGVCCFHWLENLESSNEGDDGERCEGCEYNSQQQAVHVVVLPEDGKEIKTSGNTPNDPCQMREHFQRLDMETSARRFLSEERHNQLLDGPPPSYDMLYPSNQFPPK